MSWSTQELIDWHRLDENFERYKETGRPALDHLKVDGEVVFTAEYLDEKFAPEPSVDWDINGISVERPDGFARVRAYETYLEHELKPAIPSDHPLRGRMLAKIAELKNVFWIWPEQEGEGVLGLTSWQNDYVVKCNDISVDLNDDGDYVDPGEKGFGYWFRRALAGEAEYNKDEYAALVHYPAPHLAGPQLAWVRDPETNYRLPREGFGMVLAKERITYSVAIDEMKTFARRMIESAGQASFDDFLQDQG